jgi:transposase
VQDLPRGERSVLLRINRRQFRCKNCQKVFSEKLDFVDKQKGYTQRLAKKIVEEVLDSNIRSTARRNDLTEEEIESMLESQVKKIENIDLSQITRLGLDEITLVTGQGNYLAVLVDLDTGRPIEIVKSRKKEDLRKVLLSLGSEFLSQIKEVSIDLWTGYKSLVEELMPNVDVTADRFHVMRIVNNELDAARKAEKKAVEKLKNQKDKEVKMQVIKNSKYSLLKNEESLNEKQKEKLEQVQAEFSRLKEMHEKKESFRKIYETAESWGEGVEKMLDWLYDAAKLFPESIRTIMKWFGEIVGYFDNRTTNGMVEGINNKLKLIKRLGYGFRNFENFRLRSLLTWHFSINEP